MGAAGRDFHTFNRLYREDPAIRVVAFTAAQIPAIAGRRYPPELAGPHYPQGIPIVEESRLVELIRTEGVAEVVFAYSDVSHARVMHLASQVLAASAAFILPDPHRAMLQSKLPVIAVSAVRTGCGKSQTSRWLSRRLREKGFRVAVLRHPMPYGDLRRQSVQRFASIDELTAAQCTLEEREEYEPHLEAGTLVFTGVDYEPILDAAEREADIILWDGGNNDFPFIRPDLHIVLVDPLRAGHELTHHPGEAVLRTADLVIIPKTDSATAAQIEQVEASVRRVLPAVPLIRAASPITLSDPQAVRGRRVLVVEDGPTLTHGGMAYGAGLVAARAAGAAEIVDPRAAAAPEIAALYRAYPHIGPVLPAVGYSPSQLAALRDTINAADADLVVAATPCRLAELIELNKAVICARYAFAEADTPGLGACVDEFLARLAGEGRL